ncbi:MAG: HAD family hydrolase [Gemmatimonadaceae bacterium]
MPKLSISPKAIVFDLWYTLICPEHHRPHGQGSITAIPAALGLDPKPFANYWESQLPAMYRHPRLMRDYVADYLSTFGRTLTEAERVAFDNVWSAHDSALALPRPQVQVHLTNIVEGAIRLGLLSNAHEREIRHWSASPLSAHFSAARFSCNIGCAKPERAAYCHVLDALGVAAEDAMFVGDGASNELQGARDAGFGAVVFMRGLLKELRMRESEFSNLASISDAVVDDIAEIPALFSIDGGTKSVGRLTTGRSRRAKTRG